ncbi:hypothetical protein COOONC_14428 [Cooperia oncophora]
MSESMCIFSFAKLLSKAEAQNDRFIVEWQEYVRRTSVVAWSLRQVWTSFLKARLNCSISAQYPYYFDRIQAVTRVETSDDTLFYATMSTSETAFVTSAICVFSFKSINQLFHHGFFVDPNSPNWLPLPADAVPEHRPGTCVANSHSLSDSDLHFAKSHLLMAEPVSGGTPMLATRDVIFTHIAVDVRSEQNVIFALDGRSNTLWKVSHWREGNAWKWLELERREIGVGGRSRPWRS